MRVVEFGCYLFFKHKRQQCDQTACLAALCVIKTWVFRSHNNMWLNRAFILQYYKLNISFTVKLVVKTQMTFCVKGKQISRFDSNS